MSKLIGKRASQWLLNFLALISLLIFAALVLRVYIRALKNEKVQIWALCHRWEGIASNTVCMLMCFVFVYIARCITKIVLE